MHTDFADDLAASKYKTLCQCPDDKKGSMLSCMQSTYSPECVHE